MVARIKTGTSIKGALNYNAQKCSKAEAKLIAANGFFKEKDKLGFTEKLLRFQKLTSLNQRTKTNTIHISLNFHPGEKLTEEKLQAIASVYMDKIGFGRQPYLVYQHFDAAHHHLHIVSTNIKKDGAAINMHNLGRNESEKARKEIEQDFGLIKAQGRKQTESPLQSLPGKINYGDKETKKSIAFIVNGVINQYKFSSLPELNAVLQQFGVQAYRGEKGSRMYEKGGLVYSIIDKKNNRVGVPIKASAINSKPILVNLERLFPVKSKEKEPFKEIVKEKLNKELAKSIASPKDFSNRLKKENIDVVYRQNAEGLIYGITYVDHQSKCVFNGSDLGKEFSAKGILNACTQKDRPIDNEKAPAHTEASEINCKE